MFTVYVIRNSITGRHYIGSTGNLDRRILEHNRGQTRSTRQKSIWDLIYKEEFINEIEAKRREKVIKSYKGGNALKELIKRA